MNAPFLSRSKINKRIDRFTVMSAALDLFRIRKANLARRGIDLRFAGAEAAFCIAEVKAWTPYHEQLRLAQEARDKDRLAIVEAMTPEERAASIAAIRDEIDHVGALSLLVNAGERARYLRDELAWRENPPQPYWERDTTDPEVLGLFDAVEAALKPVSITASPMASRALAAAVAGISVPGL